MDVCLDGRLSGRTCVQMGDRPDKPFAFLSCIRSQIQYGFLFWARVLQSNPDKGVNLISIPTHKNLFLTKRTFGVLLRTKLTD